MHLLTYEYFADFQTFLLYFLLTSEENSKIYLIVSYEVISCCSVIKYFDKFLVKDILKGIVWFIFVYSVTSLKKLIDHKG